MYFNSVEEAHAAAKKGKITSYIRFAPNFTEAIEDIRDDGRFADESSFVAREIQIHMDMTGKVMWRR